MKRRIKTFFAILNVVLASSILHADVTVSVTNSFAYELEATPATFQITRTGSTASAITVNFTLAGSANPAKGSASPADYSLEDGAAQPLTTSVNIPIGASSAEINVIPTVDGSAEVPEALKLTLANGAGYTIGTEDNGEIFINDATNTVANQRLFVAYLSPFGGVDSLGSGISTVRVNGDNSEGVITVQFTNLSSQLNSVQVLLDNTGTLVDLFPSGYGGTLWPINAAQTILTDQGMLDALSGGRIYLNVETNSYLNGEIGGIYNFVNGSTTLQVPPDPPPLTTNTLTTEELDRDIVRFLTQATFGPTTSTVEQLRQLIAANSNDRIAGMEAWLDMQMDDVLTSAPNLLEFTRASALWDIDSYRAKRSGWRAMSRYGKDQLRERMAFALIQIFVTSDQDGKVDTMYLGHADYYDKLTSHSFGLYRELLKDVSLHPIMGTYLSHLRNEKEQTDGMGNVIVSPDENYAREIMQLFSIGLVKLHLDGSVQLGPDGLPIPTYDNTVITEMAKVFTGLSFSKYANGAGDTLDNNNFSLGSYGATFQVRWLHPLKMFQSFHEESTKTIFNGHVIPAAQPGMQDIELVFDLLRDHPNTAPFISRRLIQRFVTSNPSAGYIYRVSTVFQNTQGDLGEVLKAILLDYEARSLDLLDRVSQGKQKEPLIRFISLLRMFDGHTNVPLTELENYGFPTTETAKYDSDASYMRLSNTNALRQTQFKAPTVFNYYLPDFVTPGPLATAGLVVPEFQITTESGMYDSINFFYGLIFYNNGLSGGGPPPGYGGTDDHFKLDLSQLDKVYDDELAAGTAQTAREALLDYLDLYLNGGFMKYKYSGAPTPNPRSIMLESIENYSDSSRSQSALYIMITSPMFTIQK